MKSLDPVTRFVDKLDGLSKDGKDSASTMVEDMFVSRSGRQYVEQQFKQGNYASGFMGCNHSAPLKRLF